MLLSRTNQVARWNRIPSIIEDAHNMKLKLASFEITNKTTKKVEVSECRQQSLDQLVVSLNILKRKLVKVHTHCMILNTKCQNKVTIDVKYMFRC